MSICLYLRSAGVVRGIKFRGRCLEGSCRIAFPALRLCLYCGALAWDTVDFSELKIQRNLAGKSVQSEFLSAGFRDVSANNRRRKNHLANFFGITSGLTEIFFPRESSRANDEWVVDLSRTEIFDDQSDTTSRGRVDRKPDSRNLGFGSACPNCGEQ